MENNIKLTARYNDTTNPTFETTNITLNNESKMGKNERFAQSFAPQTKFHPKKKLKLKLKL